uniref:PXMP2/4 family protein 2 n=1 Tax=Rhizophora mucronata TaxID=61149 RepID=A0A2P2Q044_RHIMU
MGCQAILIPFPQPPHFPQYFPGRKGIKPKILERDRNEERGKSS